MTTLKQRIAVLEKRVPTVLVSIPTIRDVINACPCEQSREAATLLIQAADPALFDIQWVMIDDSRNIHRGMTDIAEDLATQHGEPFDWIKDSGTRGHKHPTKEKWTWVLSVCMRLSMAIELDHPNHDRSIAELNRLLGCPRPQAGM